MDASVPAPVPPRPDDVAAWRVARGRAGAMLVALDFDGTLAPIVAHADDAQPPPETVAAVRSLAARPDTSVAIISGRGLADAAARLPVEGLAFAGNHGLEIRGPDIERVHPGAREAMGALASCRDAITAAIAEVPEAWVEDKGLTLSVHYRNTPESLHARVQAAVRHTAHAHTGLRITEGKRIVEVRPDVDWDKGRALLWLVEALGLPEGAPVVYIGDDTTDEDAFRVVADRGIGILVGDPRPTAARFRVESPAAVAALLERLAAGG